MSDKNIKKILITNDDGIEADGLIRLVKAVIPYGDVWVVAPDSQRSAASQSITLHDHIDIYPQKDFPVEGVKAYRCSGSPADCVRVGAIKIMPCKPDVVLSGINLGYNSGTDIQYSGTAGAAFEAAFQGIHTIALSEGFDECHEVTDEYLDRILKELMDKPLGYGQIHNVNFPGCKLSECKGILYDRTVSHGMFFKDDYKVLEELKNGGQRLMVDGHYREEAEEGSDMRAIIDKYVSVGIATNIS